MSGAFDIPRFVPTALPAAKAKPNGTAKARCVPAPMPSLADAPSSVFDMGRRIAAEVGVVPPPQPAPPAPPSPAPATQPASLPEPVARPGAPTVLASTAPLFALRSDNALTLHLDGWEGPCVVLTPDITRELFRFLDRLQRLPASEAT